MGEIVVQPWILRLSLWIMLGTVVALVATIVVARLARRERARAVTRRVGPLREDVLAVVSGDDDGRSRALLAGLRGRSADLVEPVLVGYLSKVRGTPAERITEVLAAHGMHERALAGVDSWSGTKRARSSWALGTMRADGASQAVAPLLQDRDRGVSVTAARSLGLLGDPATARSLLDAVVPGSRGRGQLPVWVVVESLVALGPAAAPTVGAALASDDASTRAVAALTIGRAQHLSQAPALRALLDHEEDPVVLTAAAGALGSVGTATDVGTLLPLARAGRPRSVRLAAALALGELGGPDAVAALADLLGDDDPRLGELVAEILVDHGPAGIAALEAHADDAGASGQAAAYGLAVHQLRRGRG